MYRPCDLSLATFFGAETTPDIKQADLFCQRQCPGAATLLPEAGG